MLSETSARAFHVPIAERARLRVVALNAKANARRHGIIDPGAVEKRELWRNGKLRGKLDEKQKELYDFFVGASGKQAVEEGARKLGKTFLFGCIALETCIRNPGKQVNWTAGTASACRKTLVPILEEISADAPPECKGSYNQSTGQWRLPNGAAIQIFSAETRDDCDRGRGPSSVLNIVDEAGFIDLLEYLLDSVFAPQQRRVHRVVGTFVGMTLLCSTTPYTPAHPFCIVADAAAAGGTYARRTIYDSGFETLEEVEAYIASEARKKNLSVEQFKETSTFKREFMSERVVDTDVVVFPEFSQPLTVEGLPLLFPNGQAIAFGDHIVREWRRPVGFHEFIYKRTAVDPGGVRDPTGILSGYTDFTNAKVVIEGERLLPRPNTHDIFEAVVELETELWGPAPDPPPGQPYLDRSRISRPVDDPTGRVTLDLWEIDRLHCQPAVKNDRNASIGLIRTWIGDWTLVIHPRCVNLRHQLRTAMSNRTKTDFERIEKDGKVVSHFDLAAALMYFCRELSLVTNPYPSTFDTLTGREMPDAHPIMSRREQMGVGRQQGGLAGAILGGNKYVSGQLNRRR